jgi:hypothetical protein
MQKILFQTKKKIIMKISRLLLGLMIFLCKPAGGMHADLTENQCIVVNSLYNFISQRQALYAKNREERVEERLANFVKQKLDQLEKELNESANMLRNINSENFIQTVRLFEKITCYFDAVIDCNDLRSIIAWRDSDVSV